MSEGRLAAIIGLWALAVVLAALAWASVRGFDDTMCRAHHACEWRNT